MLRKGGQGLSLTSANMIISESDVEAVRAVPGVAEPLPSDKTWRWAPAVAWAFARSTA